VSDVEAAPRPPSAAGTPAAPDASRPLLTALGVLAVVAVVSRIAPASWSNTAVAAVFLGATWWLVLRHDTRTVRRFGVSFGGVAEPEPLDARRLAGTTARAVGWMLICAAVTFPPFVLGYLWWWRPTEPFGWVVPSDALDRVLAQILVVALPEEAFFRGYLQTSLEAAWPHRRRRLLGAELGLGWLATSAVFAVGHVLTIPHASRLGVFFPALAFGWLRARTGGVGASVAFHALCNLFSMTLAEGFGLYVPPPPE
jgi:membrane protease YdiL (CAAX protease family)